MAELMERREEAAVATLSGTPGMVDVLGRGEEINRLAQLMDTLAANRSSCTLALSGKWGSGKTFVLERLERRLEAERLGGGRA